MAERRTPANIAFIYAVIGCSWILFSDHLVSLFFHDPHTVLVISEVKGWGYVVVTSLLLYWLIARSTAQLVQSEALLRQQANDLARSREILLRYELLAANTRDMILFLRRDDGRILDANTAACNAYGYLPEEMLELNIRDLRQAPGASLIVELAQADAEGIQFETTHRRKDGSTFPVEVSAQGATVGGVRTIISVIRDISRRREVEQALQQAYAELERRVAERTEELSRALHNLQAETDERLLVVEKLRQKERLLVHQSRQAAMGEMLSYIAHQWRQPLNALALTVQQFSLLYQMGEFKKEGLDAGVRKSMELIKHMSRTVDDFREFFSQDKEKSDFRLGGAVTKVVELVRDDLTTRHIKVEIDCREEAVVSGYPNEYAQVLLNILFNARDAFQARSTDSPTIRITVSVENGRGVVTITDNAGGIPAEILDNVFDPYFSTKGLEGTGIGLYMSKTIIERNMGGTLTARNTAEGAEFRIEI